MSKITLAAAALIALTLNATPASAGPASAVTLFAAEDEANCGATLPCFVTSGTWQGTPTVGSSGGTATVNGAYFATTATTGTIDLYVLEPDGQTVSDVLSLQFTDIFCGAQGSGQTVTTVSCSGINPPSNQLVSGTWTSYDNSTNEAPTLPNGALTIIEDGTVQDVTSLLAGTNFLPSGMTVQIQSEVPEPATMTLLGAGLLGLGIARRRR